MSSESDVAVSLWKRHGSSSLRNSAATLFSEDAVEVNFENDFQFPPACQPSNHHTFTKHPTPHSEQQQPDDRHVTSLEIGRRENGILLSYDGKDVSNTQLGQKQQASTSNNNSSDSSPGVFPAFTINCTETNHSNTLSSNNNANNNNNQTGISTVTASTATTTTVSSSSPYSSNNTTMSNDISNIKAALNKEMNRHHTPIAFRHNTNNNTKHRLTGTLNKGMPKPRRISEPVMRTPSAIQYQQKQLQKYENDLQERHRQRLLNAKQPRRLYRNRRNTGSTTPRGTTIGCLKPMTASPSTSTSSLTGDTKPVGKHQEIKLIPSTSSDTPWGLRDSNDNLVNKGDVFANELDYSNILRNAPKKISETLLFRNDRRSTGTSNGMLGSNTKMVTKFTSFIRRVFRRPSNRPVGDDEKMSDITKDDLVEQQRLESEQERQIVIGNNALVHQHRLLQKQHERRKMVDRKVNFNPSRQQHHTFREEDGNNDYIFGAEHDRNDPLFHNRGYNPDMFHHAPRNFQRPPLMSKVAPGHFVGA